MNISHININSMLKEVPSMHSSYCISLLLGTNHLRICDAAEECESCIFRYRENFKRLIKKLNEHK